MIRSQGEYRLLHEAEWEYACRAGTSTEYSSGDDEMSLVDYCQMYPSKLTSVCGEKLPNAWGLHDVHGNVEVWCWGKYVEENTIRVLRGGSFKSEASISRSAERRADHPDTRLSHVGFRVGRTLNLVPFTALPPAAGGKNFEK